MKRTGADRVRSRFNADNDNRDDPFNYDNLPHLGASPGPQELDSSAPPTFLSFYSSGSTTRRKATQETADDLDRTLTNLSPDGSTERNKSTQPLRVLVSQDDEGEGRKIPRTVLERELTAFFRLCAPMEVVIVIG